MIMSWRTERAGGARKGHDQPPHHRKEVYRAASAPIFRPDLQPKGTPALQDLHDGVAQVRACALFLHAVDNECWPDHALSVAASFYGEQGTAVHGEDQQYLDHLPSRSAHAHGFAR